MILSWALAGLRSEGVLLLVMSPWALGSLSDVAFAAQMIYRLPLHYAKTKTATRPWRLAEALAEAWA